MPSPVEALYRAQRSLALFLEARNEVSLLTAAQETNTKALVLAAASYFEHCIIEIISEFAAHRSSGDEALMSFFKKKAIDRQYHTYFSWDSGNANQFFSLLGTTIADECKKESKMVPIQDSIKAFMELGKTRNELVHLNFVSFPIEKTHEEVYDLYQRAAPFLTWLRRKLGLLEKPD